jgi:riboflavin kinase / FMN adenylyltransferase
VTTARSPTFRVFRGPDGVADAYGATVVAFGKFDGVHLGHRALLDRAAAAANRLGLPHGAVTFDRHPAVHLRGGAPPLLTGLADKLRLMRTAGARFVVLLPADATVLGVPAEEFAEDVLHKRMGVRLIVVGTGFRFGFGGAGGIVTLRRLVARSGMDGVEVGTVEFAGEPVSATRIRACLARGDVVTAGRLLARPYAVPGRSVASGVSSATVLVPAGRAVPATGEYAGSVRIGRDGARSCPAAVVVHAAERGRHRLEVRWVDGGARPRSDGPARVEFLRAL